MRGQAGSTLNIFGLIVERSRVDVVEESEPLHYNVLINLYIIAKCDMEF